MGEESGGTGRWGCTGEIRKEIEILFGKTLKKNASLKKKTWHIVKGNIGVTY